MTVFGHVALGAALGGLAPHPAAALALGIATHIPGDLVAHYDFDGLGLEILFAAAALALFVWLGDFRLAVIMGAVGGALPDAENLFARLARLPDAARLFPSHTRFLAHGEPRRKSDLAFQAALSLVMAAWVVWAPAFW